MRRQGWLTAGLIGTGVALLAVAVWTGPTPLASRPAPRPHARRGASSRYTASRARHRTESFPRPAPARALA